MDQVNLIYGDCLEKMQDIPDGSIDFICTDLPYGITNCAWDTIIPLEPMWEQVKRVIKSNGAIALFGAQPFTSILITSNFKMFKYEWIWLKNRGSNYLQAKRQPIRTHENIIIFYSGMITYNPIRETRSEESLKRVPKGMERNYKRSKCNTNEQLGKMKEVDDFVSADGLKNPTTTKYFSADNIISSYHPTQKPVKLLEYLIRTYTQENETVLDFTCGSGSTGVACIETNRNFIGIELDEKYFKIAKERIKKAQMSPRLFV